MLSKFNYVNPVVSQPVSATQVTPSTLTIGVAEGHDDKHDFVSLGAAVSIVYSPIILHVYTQLLLSELRNQ